MIPTIPTLDFYFLLDSNSNWYQRISSCVRDITGTTTIVSFRIIMAARRFGPNDCLAIVGGNNMLATTTRLIEIMFG